MATEQYRVRDLPERAKDAKDLLELLTRLEAKLEAAIADTRERRAALNVESLPKKRA